MTFDFDFEPDLDPDPELDNNNARSLQLACPSLVSSLGCTELVVAFIVQSLITGQSPNMLSSLGGGLIVTGVIILAFQAGLMILS